MMFDVKLPDPKSPYYEAEKSAWDAVFNASFTLAKTQYTTVSNRIDRESALLANEISEAEFLFGDGADEIEAEIKAAQAEVKAEKSKRLKKTKKFKTFIYQEGENFHHYRTFYDMMTEEARLAEEEARHILCADVKRDANFMQELAYEVERLANETSNLETFNSTIRHIEGQLSFYNGQGSQTVYTDYGLNLNF